MMDRSEMGNDELCGSSSPAYGGRMIPMDFHGEELFFRSVRYMVTELSQMVLVVSRGLTDESTNQMRKKGTGL